MNHIYQGMTHKLDVRPIGFVQIIFKGKNGSDFIDNFHHAGRPTGTPGPGRRRNKGYHLDASVFGQFRQTHIKARIVDGEQHIRTPTLHQLNKRIPQLPKIRQFTEYFHKSHHTVVFYIVYYLASGRAQTISAHTEDLNLRLYLL